MSKIVNKDQDTVDTDTDSSSQVTEKEPVKVRVLVDTIIDGVAVKAGKPALVTEETAKILMNNNQCDDNEEAVVYALSESEIINTI